MTQKKSQILQNSILEQEVKPNSQPHNLKSISECMQEAETILGNVELSKQFCKSIKMMPGNIYFKNREGYYLGCSNYMIWEAKLSSSNDIIGKTDYDIFNVEQADELRSNDMRVMETGQFVIIEEGIALPDGDQRYFEVVKTPLRDISGNIVGVIGNSIDITERKLAVMAYKKAKEKAEMASQLKTEFIRNMEHDIRTPFNGIWGLSNFLLENEKDPTKKTLLRDIVFSAKELLNYCNDLMDFSKVERQVLPILDKKFEFSQVVKQIMNMQQAAARAKSLKLKKEFDPDIPISLIGDQHRLLRILINLVSNAIKFTEKGHVILRVLLESLSKRQAILRFEIEDTGIGISEEKQNIIYERFSRGTLSNQGIYKGSGLGLQIVKQFVEDMSGEIEVKSAIGKGTIFTILLPFKISLLEQPIY